MNFVTVLTVSDWAYDIGNNWKQKFFAETFNLGLGVTSVFESRSAAVWLICLAGFTLVALNAGRAIPQVADLLLNADNDDQMRLLQVRDWLAGQGWFDLRQHRVLPPEGVSMHWSRYLDLGIGAVLTAFSWVMPQTQAELATVIVWPAFLACLMVLVLTHGTHRLFGGAAAVGALAVFLSWGKLGGEFVAPRIDHHNVQILFGTAIFYLALIPGRARLLGASAGATTALSLAIGLEMLPFLATNWGLMALRHAFAQPQAGDWLNGFGLALVVAAPLLLVGQTAPSAWTVSHCDALAPPVLALGAVGVVATLAPVLAERWLPGPAARIAVLVAVVGFGLWLAWPLLGHCLAGPYADVPPDLRKIIQQNIAEARPATLLWSEDPELLARVLGPPALIGFLALLTAWRLRGLLDQRQATALMQAFIVLAVGLVFALVQIRAANLMTPAVPLLGGFLLHGFSLIPRASAARVPAVLVLLLALPTSVERAATWLLQPAAASGIVARSGTLARPTADCRTASAMAEVGQLPPSVLFTTLNLGPTILLTTRHSIASAGYHRNTEAFWNGMGAFLTDADLQRALVRSRADYVVLCADGRLEATVPRLGVLLGKDRPAWLVDVTGDSRSVRLFKVDRAALTGSSTPPQSAPP